MARQPCGDATLIGSLSGPGAHDDPASADASTLTVDLGSAATVVDPSSGARPAGPSVERGETIGRYVVVGRLGDGGMGVVLAAYDPELDRRVAIKLLRPDVAPRGSEPHGHARLVREAQALAKVGHPNVVTVFDVGTHGEGVFIAMELVEGITLGRWLSSRARDWREVVRMFRQAGQGLYAAHRAGLVHRDFKPDNVLVGNDGRARVTDFGLVRADAEVLGGSGEGPAPSDDALRRELTTPGVYVGTPAYMAPEQFRKESATAQTDQWSFCASLWRGLYGERPFSGERFEDLMRAVLARKLRAVPKSARVPAFVHRALERGLSLRPEDRFGDLGELLDALGRDPATRRRRFVYGALAVALPAAIATGVVLQAGQHLRSCRSAAPAFEGVWDAARRAQLAAAFSATGRGHAADTARRASEAIDARVKAIRLMAVESCEATHLRGTQSAQLLDLRARCLGDREHELRALLDTFAKADEKLVDDAALAVAALPSAEACADAASLLDAPAPKGDRARRLVDRVDEILAEARALRAAGRGAAALALASRAVALARESAHGPSVAEALRAEGDLLEVTGKLPDAERALDEALLVAEAARADAEGARVLVELVALVGDRQARFDLGLKYAALARAKLQRTGGSPALEADLRNHTGSVLYRKGAFPEARVELERALALATRTGADPLPVAGIANNLGLVLRALGDHAGALAANERALAIKARLVGEDHPSIAVSLGNLATVLAERGQLAKAREYLERSLAIKTKAFGPRHRSVGIAWNNLGDLARDEKQFARAKEAYGRAIEILQTALGPEHPLVAYPLTGLGASEVALGHAAAGVAPLERALAIRQVPDADPAERAETELALAEAVAGSDAARARTLARAAAARWAALGARGAKDAARAEAFAAQRRR